jgi:hypothetical protein
MHEPSPTFVGAVLAFLRGLNGPILVTVLAIAGIVYISALLARADRDMPTPGVVGIGITVFALTVVALTALRIEGKRNATHSERSRN